MGRSNTIQPLNKNTVLRFKSSADFVLAVKLACNDYK